MAIGKIRKKYLKNIGINYIGLAYKPLKSSFKKALHDINLRPDEVFMIGDDYFSDIYGGNRNKLRTVLINKKIKLAYKISRVLSLLVLEIFFIEFNTIKFKNYRLV